MRTIKFRGKRIDNGEWAYGSLDLTGEYPTISWLRTDEDGDQVPWFATEEDETIGQFTGLYDKNGTEIYEGDIILCKDKHVYSVEWLSDGFYMRGKLYGGVTSIKSFLPNQREVIGNIHNNPELISKKQ